MQVREMKTILSFGFISTTVDLYIICLLFVCCSLNLVWATASNMDMNPHSKHTKSLLQNKSAADPEKWALNSIFTDDTT